MRSAIAVVLIFASFQSLDCQSDRSNSRLNYFDIDLLRYCAEGKSGNVMVSPASIKSTLAMLLEGARGETAFEIQTALRLPPNKEDFRQQLSMFFMALEVNSSSVSVQNANGLFVSRKLHLNKEYEMMARNVYFAEVNKVNFGNPRKSAAAINSWVNEKTKGLIPSIISEEHIEPLTQLLVTNALYFKGTWLREFDTKATRGDCFYKNGVCKNVAMMSLQSELNYAYVDNLRAHALELPYQGKRYSMILLVPQDRDAGVALIRDLPYIGLLQISNLLEPTDVILTMPKFTVEYGDDMVSVLKNMRIKSLFSPSANLTGIIEDSNSAYLNSIYHKVYMSVDEKGTVAAAATAGMVVPLINNQVQLRIDRPFLFFIWDNEKGVVLFEGKIEDPTEFPVENKKEQPIKPVVIPSSSPELILSNLNDAPARLQPVPAFVYPTEPAPPKKVQTQTTSSPSSPPKEIIVENKFKLEETQQTSVSDALNSNRPISNQETTSTIQPAVQQKVENLTVFREPKPSTPDALGEYSDYLDYPEHHTTRPPKKSESSWFKKISSYFTDF